MSKFLSDIKVRSTIVIRHITQSTTACLLAMTKGNLYVISWHHWEIAICTGLGTGVISLLASYGDLVKFQTSRYGVAAIAFIGTTIADFISHGGTSWKESLVTGIGAALLSFFVSFTPLDKYLANLQEKKEEN
ncbi:hypothetical protein [Legionella micdadei]|uniref:Holin n=1 Tax=Legionella micdadei TaxID=451 RepID=A0A098GEZ5_LEGMI|nr:hypothetical protein [Legionella micdadei]ARG97471.1 hypothetical protein B6N58_07220 [Legionella micdadei]KTD28366.1 hypothetical protein Lmic_1477 [Legionella micdadei]NSL16993.1 hypothetical protein [Legionella micdadei]CEG61043.1 conserved membrane protein of unknown function [Legionella micdadei]SCY70941.1 hypothetical protein SAMN02982997_02610 [Legionella micdadei]